MKNNKRGLGADKVKKKAVKPDHGDSSKGDNKQVLLSLRFAFVSKGFGGCYKQFTIISNYAKWC